MYLYVYKAKGGKREIEERKKEKGDTESISIKRKSRIILIMH